MIPLLWPAELLRPGSPQTTATPAISQRGLWVSSKCLQREYEATGPCNNLMRLALLLARRVAAEMFLRIVLIMHQSLAPAARRSLSWARLHFR
jgi:hypothetical protein